MSKETAVARLKFLVAPGRRAGDFASPAHDPTLPFGKVKRKQRDGSIKEVPCLKTVSDYNCFMNGVDRADCMRVQYPTYRMCKRWWTYLFWFCFDLSVANAFILLQESPNHLNNPCENQLAFRMQLIHLLIGKFRNGNKKRKIPTMGPSGVEHWPKTVPQKKRCQHCLSSQIRHESRVVCNGIHLCIDCFLPYHKDILPAIRAN